MCEHKNIVIATRTYYHIEEGYNKMMEKENVDMAKYEQYTRLVTRCQDCEKILEKI